MDPATVALLIEAGAGIIKAIITTVQNDTTMTAAQKQEAYDAIQVHLKLTNAQVQEVRFLPDPLVTT